MLIPMTFAFSQGIIVAYLLFVTIHATWEHTNFGPSIKLLEPYLITPRFHHWHHTLNGPLNRNYASTLPWLDRIFGTHYLPKEWPAAYGIKAKVPDSLAGQLAYPLRPQPLAVSLLEAEAVDKLIPVVGLPEAVEATR